MKPRSVVAALKYRRGHKERAQEHKPISEKQRAEKDEGQAARADSPY